MKFWLLGLAKWPWRCSAAEGSAACGARGRPPRLACSVPCICARARLKRRTPARLGAAATNCGPCPAPLCSADLQAPGAGAGGSPGACAMRAPAASPMEGTAPLRRGPRRVAVPDGHPRRDAVAQAGFPAVGPRGAAGAARRGWLGASDLGGRAGELFAAACGGCLRSLTKRVLACVQVAVEMPFSSTLAAAAGATERLRGCTVARKISLLVLSIFAHRGVGRR